MTCARRNCTSEVPEGNERYCSLRCRRAAKRLRNPSSRKARARYNARRPKDHPFQHFVRAVKKRGQVPDRPGAEGAARRLIAAGYCGYENARGQIKDVGIPKNEADRGRIFSRVVRDEAVAA